MADPLDIVAKVQDDAGQKIKNDGKANCEKRCVDKEQPEFRNGYSQTLTNIRTDAKGTLFKKQ